eukprot:jgi/Mesen1/7313/ME000376S06478
MSALPVLPATYSFACPLRLSSRYDLNFAGFSQSKPTPWTCLPEAKQFSITVQRRPQSLLWRCCNIIVDIPSTRIAAQCSTSTRPRRDEQLDRLSSTRRIGVHLEHSTRRHGSLLMCRAAEQASSAPSSSDFGVAAGPAKKWVHFVGIGGAGLSALAFVALKQGWQVSGSDLEDSQRLEALTVAGATVYVGHSASQVKASESTVTGALPDAVVVSSAVSASNVEVEAARAHGVPVYKRDEWLGKLTASADLIAVAGSHGKTSTASMLALALHDMGKDLTAVIGAEVPQFPGGGSTMVGSGKNFVLEADEYDECFLGVTPSIAIVTNVEWEHVDMFPNEAAVRLLFRRFVRKIRPQGTLVACGDNAGSKSLTSAFEQGGSDALDGNGGAPAAAAEGRAAWLDRADGRQVVTYGLADSNDWRAVMLVPNSQGGSDYVAVHQGMPMARVSLQLPGTHNVLNSLAVLVVAALLAAQQQAAGEQSIQLAAMKAAAEAASMSLARFEGVKRRFELLGRVPGCVIYDDYAHHPTEVRATLQAARQRFDQQPLWVVFQPHTYSRLEKLLVDFAPSFSAADRVIVSQVYAAREEDGGAVSGADLAAAITGPPTLYLASQDEMVERLVWEVAAYRNNYLGQRGDIVLFILGAGDIVSLGPKLLRELA